VAKPRIHNNKLQGRVVDEKGTPIAGALIRPEPYSDLWLREQRGDSNTSSTTDQKGDFAFSRLASGELSLLISAKGYKSLETLAPTDSADFRAVLRPASEPDRYWVTVVDQEGKPIENAPVTIWQNIVQGGQRTTAIRTAKTNTTGKADIELPFNGAMPQGNLSFIYCDMEGRNLAFYPARHSGDAQITLRASPGGSHWHGEVVDPSEKPIEGAMVRVVSLQPWKAGFRGNVYFSEWGAKGNANLNLTTKTDHTGRFEIPRISSNDSVHAIAWAPGYVMHRVYFYPSDPEYKDGKTIALAPAGTVEGRLVIKGTDKSFPGSDKVSIAFVSKTTGDSVQLMEPPRDGAFRADYLARGTYTATVEITDPAWSRYTCTPPPSFEIVTGKTTKVTIELEEGPAKEAP
jgi:protocatechuate 3,4-dioxygenase beta subunit